MRTNPENVSVPVTVDPLAMAKKLMGVDDDGELLTEDSLRQQMTDKLNEYESHLPE